jgi:hypothetical protein
MGYFDYTVYPLEEFGILQKRQGKRFTGNH